MLIYEYKLDGTKQQYSAIDEAIRVRQFIRNKCLRLWMDEQGISQNDLQCYCAVLAREFPFAARLNSQARQASADRAQIAAFPVKQIKRVRIVHRADGYYCQFSVQAERQVEHIPTGSVVGIDMGLKVFYTDSNGNTVENPRHYCKAEKKLKRLHRRVSKKQKKSKNRKKARNQLAKAYLKVQRQREDFARKTANTLVSSHDLIAYEHLQIRNLVKNHKLAKSIHDAAWGQFLGWVKSYAVMHGIEVVAIPSQYTSQDCSGCGERVQKTLSTRTHICPNCGLILDRDENAALNILAKALDGTVV